jgi:hypothetical protein
MPLLLAVALLGCGGSDEQKADTPRAAAKSFLGDIASGDYASACKGLTDASRKDLSQNAVGGGCEEFLRSQFKLPGGNKSYRTAKLTLLQHNASNALFDAEVPERKLALPVVKSGDVWRVELIER